MQLLFNPRSIAVIGATRDLTRAGSLPIFFLRKHGYTGKIFPVNPNYRKVSGLPCYPSPAAIPEEVDLALIGIPRQGVMGALRDCAEKKIRYAILFSAGFAETGAAGRSEQEALLRVARESGIRLVGPNCIGMVNTHGHVAASFTSGLDIDSLLTGSVGLITQSGGIGNCLLTRAHDRGIGFSYFVSSGNEADLEVSDFLEFMIDDGQTQAIALLIESLRNPTRFAAVARRALQAGKAIVALKAGWSAAGQKATASHTGALTSADGLYEGLFRQLGISRVFDIDDLLEAANLFACCLPPQGNRLAVLTTSGGSGALLADLASNHHLQLPAPSQHTRERLREFTPAVTAIANPMDMTGQFIHELDVLEHYLRTFAEDESYDIVVVNFTFSPPESALKVAERIAALAPSLAKPLIVCWPVGEATRPAFACLEKARVPLFFHPSRCLSALGHFVRFGMRRYTADLHP